MILCDCTTAFGNTGLSPCEQIAKATVTWILMSKYNAEGELNFIDVSNPATLGATVRALTTAATDPLSRLYPLPVAENVTAEKTATIFETAPSNRKYRVQEGVRTFLGQFMGDNSSVRFLGELNKFGCDELVFFNVDTDGSIWGSTQEEGKLYGVDLSSSSFDTMLMFATDTTTQKIQLQFDVAYGFDDSTWKSITAANLGYSALALRGLVSANMVAGTITTTSTVVSISYATNSAVNQTKPITGLLPADFTVNELDPTPGAVVVLTAPESLVTPGTYTVTWAAQTSADILEISAARGSFEIFPVQVTIP